MKFLLLALLLATACGLQSQTIVFKDGKTIEGKNLRRSGNSVMSTVTLGKGQGEVGYAVNTIARIEFPLPPQIPAVEELLVTAKAAEALVQIEPVVNALASFKDIPGGQWLEAANLRVASLHALGRDQQAAPMVTEMVASADAEVHYAGQVWQAAALAKNDAQKALLMLEEVLKNSTLKSTLANAWLQKSVSLAALEKSPEALVASLHVPVFFPEQKMVMPPALLVGARAFFAMEDFPMARRAMQDVIQGFPNSSEAKTATANSPKSNAASNPLKPIPPNLPPTD